MANESPKGEQAQKPTPATQTPTGETPARPKAERTSAPAQPARPAKGGAEGVKTPAAKAAPAAAAKTTPTAEPRSASAAGPKSGAAPAAKTGGASATRPQPAGAAKGQGGATKGGSGQTGERRSDGQGGKAGGQAKPAGERSGERRGGGSGAGQPRGTAAPTGGPTRPATPGSTRPGNNLPSAAHPSNGAPSRDRLRPAGAPATGPQRQGGGAPRSGSPAPNAFPNTGRSGPSNPSGPSSSGGNAPRSGSSGANNARPGARGNGRKQAPKRREGDLPPPPPLTTARTATKTEAPPVTEVIIPSAITVRELAEKMRRSPIDVIKALMNYGIMVPITQTIDFDTAVVVGEDLGIAVKSETPPEPELSEVKEETAPQTLRQKIMAEEKEETLVIRPPIVTVLGHVDHGKTTLLDAIRETRVVDGEAGGITQHIGAYQVERQGRKITFLDTPGHAAFTAMRARGAMVTDIAVLVVAADDGVMPQTKEAIAHARAARVPIVVALNKVDKPNANPERVKQELADNGLLIEEYGGDVICVPVSAKMRRGIEDLLENLVLVADIDPLRANPQGNCIGTVIESRLDKNRGPLATLLVQNGTLHVGDSLVADDIFGKVRAMYDDKGQPITEATPSTPVVVLGLTDVVNAGDTFTVEDERTARALASERLAKNRADASAAAAPKAVALDTIFAQAQAGKTQELNLILKADVQGSIEPIVNSLNKLGDEKLKVKILHQGTGNITESDVMLAVASKAIILGFSVIMDGAVQRTAEVEGVDIRIYSIIYNLIEDVEKALKGLLEPVYKDVVLGHAEVRVVFRVTKVGKVAGCYVTDGELVRNAMARIKRGGQVLKEDKIVSLKRFQEDASEVKTGFECGLNFGNFNEFEVGDVIEAYKKERVS
ncbi:MAG: translation initiation factor IF-2 [Chloroflexi bacterium]|nr:translation initiation factor IF-2 [Chloroflexota bacterium]